MFPSHIVSVASHDSWRWKRHGSDRVVFSCMGSISATRKRRLAGTTTRRTTRLQHVKTLGVIGKTKSSEPAHPKQLCVTRFEPKTFHMATHYLYHCDRLSAICPSPLQGTSKLGPSVTLRAPHTCGGQCGGGGPCGAGGGSCGGCGVRRGPCGVCGPALEGCWGPSTRPGR